MQHHRHFIIHKPFGYLSQFVNNQTKRKNKKLLGELHDFPEGIMAIGRLDETSAPIFKTRTKKLRDSRHGPTSWISIIITEGKFRQVRKMTAKVGFPTLRLLRVRIGTTYLNDLQSGEILEVSKFEI